MPKITHITKSDKPNARKRSDMEIARDRALIAEMYYKGWHIMPITEFLNAREGIEYSLSRQTVSYDKRKMLEEMQEAQRDNTEGWVTEEIYRLQLIESEAWTAWKKSMEDAETEKIVQALHNVDGDDKKMELIIERIEKVTSGKVGDRGYLEIILKCINERARLRGLHTFKVAVKSEQTHMLKMYGGGWTPEDAWGDNGAQAITEGEFEETKQITDGD